MYNSQEDAAAVLKHSNFTECSSILSRNTQENSKGNTFEKQATSTILDVVKKLIAFEIDQAYLITCAMAMA